MATPRITFDQLRGIWAGLPMSWDEEYGFDELSYRANLERLCAAEVHGVYTSGSTGEFYALDFDEFRRMVDIQDEVCGAHTMPLQIGCCTDDTRDTIRLLEYAAGKRHVGAAQVVVPYWMELTDRELLQFFGDLHRACPELPLVHYNVPRAKRFLLAQDYLRLLEVAPNLIGVKFTYGGSHFADLEGAIAATPQVSYFVGENLLVSAMMLGARGSYSSLVMTNPVFMLKMYEQAAQRRWEEATAMQQALSRFLDEALKFITDRGEGCADPVFDKGLSVAAGFLVGSQRTRPPYIGWSDDTMAALRAWLRERYPQFILPMAGSGNADR
jgi:dihydrodipicolinate synthase/N-acetylneuraminate lyase